LSSLVLEQLKQSTVDAIILSRKFLPESARTTHITSRLSSHHS